MTPVADARSGLLEALAVYMHAINDLVGDARVHELARLEELTIAVNDWIRTGLVDPPRIVDVHLDGL